jgi:hypothetical protein
MPRSSAPELSLVPGGPVGRAIVRWTDPDRARRHAERRIGRPVHVAVPLLVDRRPGAPVRLLVALSDDTVYLLELRGSRNVGGVTAALPRTELVAHFHRRLRRLRAELSWPDRQAFIAGRLTPGAAADELIGLVTADELEQQR